MPRTYEHAVRAVLLVAGVLLLTRIVLLRFFPTVTSNSVGTWLLGGTTTLIVSSLVLKLQIYLEAQKNHLDDLKKQVLVPLSDESKRLGNPPSFLVNWGLQQYNASAPSYESPILEGPVLLSSIGPNHLHTVLDPALLEDARTYHYHELISSWESFKDSYETHLGRRRKWIASMAEHILDQSGLPEFQSNSPLTSYVRNLKLAVFAYNRLTQQKNKNKLHLDRDFQFISDGEETVAVGALAKLLKISDLLDNVIIAQRVRASELQTELAKLESEALALSNKFSYEIANKRPLHPCKLVPFRTW